MQISLNTMQVIQNRESIIKCDEPVAVVDYLYDNCVNHGIGYDGLILQRICDYGGCLNGYFKGGYRYRDTTFFVEATQFLDSEEFVDYCEYPDTEGKCWYKFDYLVNANLASNEVTIRPCLTRVNNRDSFLKDARENCDMVVIMFTYTNGCQVYGVQYDTEFAAALEIPVLDMCNPESMAKVKLIEKFFDLFTGNMLITIEPIRANNRLNGKKGIQIWPRGLPQIEISIGVIGVINKIYPSEQFRNKMEDVKTLIQSTIWY